MGTRTDAARRWLVEAARGVAWIRHGFAFWRVRPGLMALGFLPPIVVGALFAALLVVLGVNLETISEAATPFAEDWWEWTKWSLRTTLAVALFAGALVLTWFAFTALTLLLGEPIYARIWRAVEERAGGMPAGREPGFWRTVADSGRLVVQGAVFGALVGLWGLVPVLGVLAPFAGFVISSRLVALELTARALEARGLDRTERLRMLRARGPRLLGFGVAVHLFYLIPGGQVAVMPAAVVAATLLAREAHDASQAAPPV